MTWYLMLVICALALGLEACYLCLMDALEDRR